MTPLTVYFPFHKYILKAILNSSASRFRVAVYAPFLAGLMSVWISEETENFLVTKEVNSYQAIYLCRVVNPLPEQT